MKRRGRKAGATSFVVVDGSELLANIKPTDKVIISKKYAEKKNLKGEDFLAKPKNFAAYLEEVPITIN